jgi:hypothetical protein
MYLSLDSRPDDPRSQIHRLSDSRVVHPLHSSLPWRLPPVHLVCETDFDLFDLLIFVFHNTDTFYLTPLDS